MKSLYTVGLLLFFVPRLHAQMSGTVIYKETARLHFNIQGDAPPPANLPTERNAQMLLYYTPEVSLYLNDPSANNEGGIIEEESHDGEMVRIRMEAPDNRTYCDLKNNVRLEQKEFMQRKFLVETSLQSSDWKLTGKQKMVLNYPCHEATRTDGERKLVAWFTTSIPVASGPAANVGLPGLVLEVNINDGDQVITATSLKAGAVDPSLLVKPKDGKKVTEEEYKKIVDEKMKEMGMEPGGGNQVIIRINEK